MKNLIPTLLILSFALTGCTRASYTSHYAEAVVFGEPKTVPLPEGTSYAIKRGFDDFNCDQIPDMLEIRDEAVWGQDFSVTVFPGYYNNDGIVQFSNDAFKMKLPINLEWFSSSTKMDVGDVNGECYSDIIFTQYYEPFLGDDTMYIAFALNRGGKEFEHYTEQVNWKGGELGARIWSWSARHNRNEEESLYDYLKMDWGDMDGNGSADLVLAWDEVSGMDLTVLYTEDDPSGLKVGIESEGSTWIDGFTRGRDIHQFDIEDFDGDGKQDLFIHKTHLGGNEFTTSVATNNGGTSFTPHKDHRATDTNLALLRFEKYDTFDVNNDNCADFVHLGVQAGQKVMSYNLVTCE